MRDEGTLNSMPRLKSRSKRSSDTSPNLPVCLRPYKSPVAYQSNVTANTYEHKHYFQMQ